MIRRRRYYSGALNSIGGLSVTTDFRAPWLMFQRTLAVPWDRFWLPLRNRALMDAHFGEEMWRAST